MILGVVLAGGLSTRFGSDKALATFGGRSLLLHAVDNLSGQCEQVVIAGREIGPAPCIPDWPGPNMGPLAGIAAGLHYAQDMDFESVMTCGVDSPDVSQEALADLSAAPCYLADQPVIGHWPVGAASTIERILEGTGKHSMLAFAEAIGATAVKSAGKPANINSPADLTALEHGNGI
ncbi:MAG TPA: molybdenum cofactor guanylyltransferase [Croceibacterium sp.]|nr:molybdenum cofactor guanylyltransferase [Croceibacterium sp.]